MSISVRLSTWPAGAPVWGRLECARDMSYAQADRLAHENLATANDTIVATGAAACLPAPNLARVSNPVFVPLRTVTDFISNSFEIPATRQAASNQVGVRGVRASAPCLPGSSSRSNSEIAIRRPSSHAALLTNQVLVPSIENSACGPTNAPEKTASADRAKAGAPIFWCTPAARRWQKGHILASTVPA